MAHKTRMTRGLDMTRYIVFFLAYLTIEDPDPWTTHPQTQSYRI